MRRPMWMPVVSTRAVPTPKRITMIHRPTSPASASSEAVPTPIRATTTLMPRRTMGTACISMSWASAAGGARPIAMATSIVTMWILVSAHWMNAACAMDLERCSSVVVCSGPSATAIATEISSTPSVFVEAPAPQMSMPTGCVMSMKSQDARIPSAATSMLIPPKMTGRASRLTFLERAAGAARPMRMETACATT